MKKKMMEGFRHEKPNEALVERDDSNESTSSFGKCAEAYTIIIMAIMKSFGRPIKRLPRAKSLKKTVSVLRVASVWKRSNLRIYV